MAIIAQIGSASQTDWELMTTSLTDDEGLRKLIQKVLNEQRKNPSAPTGHTFNFAFNGVLRVDGETHDGSIKISVQVDAKCNAGNTKLLLNAARTIIGTMSINGFAGGRSIHYTDAVNARADNADTATGLVIMTAA